MPPVAERTNAYSTKLKMRDRKSEIIVRFWERKGEGGKKKKKLCVRDFKRKDQKKKKSGRWPGGEPEATSRPF